MKRVSALALALSALFLACGGESDLVPVGDDDVGGSNGGPNGGGYTGAADEPDAVEPDDFAVPPTDEELETGVEGENTPSAEELAVGEENRRGFAAPAFTGETLAAATANHSNVDPQNVMPAGLKATALAYYDANKNKGKGLSDKYMVVINMGVHSKEERFFLIDMQSGAVTKTVVAHGSGSDRANTGTANRFSNTPNSNMTSLGFYRFGEVYNFKGRPSGGVRLDGLDPTNDKARARGIVFHAASYVSKGRAKQGRSSGCPAVSNGEYAGLRDKLKNGALLYITNQARTPDTCDGKADGYYCSEINRAAAYNCRGGVSAGSAFCQDSSKACKADSSGRATTTGGTLTCQ